MSHTVEIRDPDTKRLYNYFTRHPGLDPVSSPAQATSKEKADWMPDQVRHDEKPLILPQIHQSRHLPQFHCRHIIDVTGPIHNIITLAIKDVNKYYSTAQDSGTRALKGIRRNDNISLFSCRSNRKISIPPKRGGQGYDQS